MFFFIWFVFILFCKKIILLFSKDALNVLNVKDMYNVAKDFYFRQMLLNFLFWKKSYHGFKKYQAVLFLLYFLLNKFSIGKKKHKKNVQTPNFRKVVYA